MNPKKIGKKTKKQRQQELEMRITKQKVVTKYDMVRYGNSLDKRQKW
jgi:hypothetical protein